MQNLNPYVKKFDGMRPRPSSSSDKASSSKDDQLPPEVERQMKQRLMEADLEEESQTEAVLATSSSSCSMWPLISCRTCGQGNQNAFRVGCRGPGCRHSVCTACACKDDSGNLDYFYCVHCFEPERQRRIGWTNIGTQNEPHVEAQHESPQAGAEPEAPI